MKLKHKQNVVTIGTFDGVHLGHQKILQKIIQLSKEKEYSSTVLTFFPHPRMVLQKDDSIKLINTIEERITLLKHFGVERIIRKEFTKDFANLSAENYVKRVLIDELKANYIVVGYDHRFGKNRSAGIDDLKIFAKSFNFEIEEIPAKDINQVAVSSTKIRKALAQGNIALANKYLGYSYFLTGEVIKGKSIGRTLGFPTANIYIKETYKLIPNDGVYVVKCLINSSLYFGMMNIGKNPTIKDKKRSIEVHFFNFESNIYGQNLKVELLTRLRSEQKFDSLNDLKKALEKDKTKALNYINQLH